MADRRLGQSDPFGGARGVPFFFLRVDRAGNVTKRFNATGFTLAEEGGADEAMIIGGAEIYTQALDRANRIYLTEISATPPGDAFFPEFDRAEWSETDRQDREPESDGGPAYSFVILDRKI